ncbi:hypothetical protein [Xenorhabdus taiwanensis]|uniref:Secreted protein n=1 Tax=Xenorhabdus taiwanensis TaxID=3085177 RepID=A0ABN7C5J8_9GAMM|nr:hypothetical protein TCT1_25720 [Xenorhabdus sp. TCT-1]
MKKFILPCLLAGTTLLASMLTYANASGALSDDPQVTCAISAYLPQTPEHTLPDCIPATPVEHVSG